MSHTNVAHFVFHVYWYARRIMAIMAISFVELSPFKNPTAYRSGLYLRPAAATTATATSARTHATYMFRFCIYSLILISSLKKNLRKWPAKMASENGSGERNIVIKMYTIIKQRNERR